MSTVTKQPEETLQRLLAQERVDRLHWLRAQQEPVSVLLDLIEFASRTAISETDLGTQQLVMMTELSDELGEALPRCRARRAAVRALSYGGRYAQAIATAHEAASIALESGIAEEQGRAKLAEMHPLVEMGRLREALAAGESARSIFVSAQLPSMAARADINLGVTHQKSDSPRQAVECFDRARDALCDEPLTIGHLENNRGEALLALNDFAGAEAAFTAALEAFETADVHLTAAIASGNLADLAVRQGRLSRAMHFFERARRALEKAGSPTHLARVIAEQAEAQTLLGMNEQALRQFEQALTELDRSGCRIEAARARRGMGMAMVNIGRLSEAETLLAAAATSFEQLGHRSASAHVNSIRAEILAHHGALREARHLALKGLADLDDRPADAIGVRHLIARIAEQHGNVDEAVAELDTAIATARRYDIAPVLAALLGSRGRIHRTCGRIGQARRDLREALNMVDRVRGSLQAQRFRAAFFGRWTELYEELIDLLLDDDDAASVVEAFDVAERSRSRSMLDRLTHETSSSDHRESSNGTAAEELHAALDKQRADLNALYSRLADGQFNLTDDDSLTVWRTSIREHEHQINDLEDRLASMTAGGLYAPSCQAQSVQAALGNDELLVEYVATGCSISTFLITRDEVRVLPHVVNEDEVHPLLEQLAFQMNRALQPGVKDSWRLTGMVRAAQRCLRDLHSRLAEPWADYLHEKSRVVIVPCGALHRLPFHALHDGERYLIEAVEVVTAPSASIFVSCSKAEADSSRMGNALIIGLDDGRAPHMIDEARRIRAMFSGSDVELLEDRAATADAVLGALGDAGLVHMSCHGYFIADTPQAAGVKLADRWLTALDLAAARLSAELVVLSGCETGLASVHAGDEIVGLPGALLSAGARSVLLTLWRIDDQSSLEFAEQLYRRLRNTTLDFKGRKAAAVRAAQLEMMRRHPHPAFWAPFKLAGGA